MSEPIEKQSQSCPHCGKPVDPLRSPAVSVIGGKIAHFCSPDCRESHLQRSPQKETAIPDALPAAPPTSAETAKAVVPEKTGTGRERRVTEERSPLFRRPLWKAALLAAVSLSTLILPGMIALAVSGLSVLAVLIHGAAKERSLGPARALEAAAEPVAGALVLLGAAFGLSPRQAAFSGSALLFLQTVGRLIELLGRRRSGILSVMDGSSRASLASAWRDNSAVSEKIRRVTLALEWARFPLAGCIGLVVYFAYSQSIAEALLSGTTALLALGPRPLRMCTGDAHLSAALAASGKGARIRDAHLLDQIALSRIVLFIAKRSLVQEEMRIVDWKIADGSDEARTFAALGALEASATGRLASAIGNFLRERIKLPFPIESLDFREGRGVVGTAEGGSAVCGSRSLMLEELISTALLEPQAKAIEASGRRAVFLAVDGQLAAVFGAEETPRRGVEAATHKLKIMGFEPAMLTTAEIDTAQAFGTRLGIEHVRFETSEDQVDAVLDQLAATGDRAALVGHGRAFEEHWKAAAAAIAVGGDGPTEAGVDARGQDIGIVPWLFETAKRTRRSIALNLLAACSALFVGLALSLGWFSPLVVVFAGALGFGASALSTLNGPYPAVTGRIDRLRAWVDRARKIRIGRARTAR